MLSEQLQLEGNGSWLKINTMHNFSSEASMSFQEREVPDIDDSNREIPTKTLTRNSTSVGKEHIGTEELCQDIPHRKAFLIIFIPSNFLDVSVCLLLDSNWNLAWLKCWNQHRLELSKTEHYLQLISAWIDIEESTNPPEVSVVDGPRLVVGESCIEIVAPFRVLKVLEHGFAE